MRQCDPQVEQSRTAADDEFAIEQVDVRQASRPVGADQQFAVAADEAPWLGVVAGRSQDCIADSKARFVQQCTTCWKVGGRNTPGLKISSVHSLLLESEA
jgi:hypothetical protein